MTSVLYRADDDDFAEVVGPRWLHVAWREFAKKGDKNLACLVRPKAQPVAPWRNERGLADTRQVSVTTLIVPFAAPENDSRRW
jgi:hypothetical protein